MSFKATRDSIANDLDDIKAAGLWKTERYISSDQKNEITLSDGSTVINMCANNYLGLANNLKLSKLQKLVMINGALGWLQLDLFVALRHT